MHPQPPVNSHRRLARRSPKRRSTAFAASALLILISPCSFAADTLPLKHGIYVDASQTCQDPANAGIKQYDGKGLSTAHTHGCVLQVQGKKGTTYTVAQRCIDAGAGPAPFVNERMDVTVVNPGKFVFKQGKTATAFNHCSPSELPPGLK